MALTAGLLTFLAIDALAEALELQAALPSSLQGTGLVLVGVVVSYLALTWISTPLLREERPRARPVALRLALATLVAIGIGLHNLGEGLAIGSSFAFGELALGSVPDRRLHDPQRHRGPRHRGADRRGRARQLRATGGARR